MSDDFVEAVEELVAIEREDAERSARDFDRVVARLRQLEGEQVNVQITDLNGVPHAALAGRLRRVETEYLIEKLKGAPGVMEAFYVDGGQDPGWLPALILMRSHCEALGAQDMPELGIGWTAGQIAVLLIPDVVRQEML